MEILMRVELIMAEFGEERKNMGGNLFEGSQRLDPTLTTFTNHMMYQLIRNYHTQSR